MTAKRKITPAFAGRIKLSDEAMLLLIKTFKASDTAQAIVDGIRVRGYQASLNRVTTLVNAHFPFIKPGQQSGGTAKILNFKKK
jgi:cell division septation protein DedD